jgi:hypothetical protein
VVGFQLCVLRGLCGLNFMPQIRTDSILAKRCYSFQLKAHFIGMNLPLRGTDSRYAFCQVPCVFTIRVP